MKLELKLIERFYKTKNKQKCSWREGRQQLKYLSELMGTDGDFPSIWQTRPAICPKTVNSPPNILQSKLIGWNKEGQDARKRFE